MIAMLAINELSEFAEVDEPQFITLSPVNVDRVKSELRELEEKAHDGKTARICAYCGKPIDPSKPYNARFCSRECNWRFHYEKKRKEQGLPFFDVNTRRTCAYCGAELDPSRRSHTKYCNSSCRRKDYWRAKKAEREKVDA